MSIEQTLERIAVALEKIAAAPTQSANSDTTTPKKTRKARKTKVVEPAEEPPAEEPPKKTRKKKVTADDVRKALSAKAKAGHTRPEIIKALKDAGITSTNVATMDEEQLTIALSVAESLPDKDEE